MEQIIRFYLNEDNNTIEIVKMIPSNAMYACNPPRPVPNTVFKEIYGIKDNKIQLIEKINGNHIPASYHEEQFIF